MTCYEIIIQESCNDSTCTCNDETFVCCVQLRYLKFKDIYENPSYRAVIYGQVIFVIGTTMVIVQ
jgi:hypothetical protein